MHNVRARACLMPINTPRCSIVEKYVTLMNGLAGGKAICLWKYS